MDAWEWLGFGLVATAVLSIFVTIGIAVFSAHELNDYYLRSNANGGTVSFQIYNDRAYAEDTIAFITDDEEKAVKTLERLKATLNGK